MASSYPTNCRGRSQSIGHTSPYPHGPFAENSTYTTKRAYGNCISGDPDFICSPMLESESLRFKRRRREISASISDSTAHSATSFLPSTSAEFSLFPKGARKAARSRSQTEAVSNTMAHTAGAPVDAVGLKTNAFWQLHNTVAENGEGLVRRMRDYEHTRSRIDAYSKAKDAHKRGRKRSSIHVLQPPRKVVSLPHDSESSDDDVEIMGGEFSAAFWLGHHSKRAASMDSMQVDSPRHSPSLQSEDYYPTSFRSTSPPYNAVNEDLYHRNFHSPCIPTPALSLAASNSANSSQISLSSDSQSQTSPQPATVVSPNAPFMATSRSEKALAALTLAMANGAGSIEDYESVLALQQSSTLDDSHAGDMWD